MRLDFETEWPIPSYFNGSSGPNYTQIIAYAWDDFSNMVNDTKSITRLADVDSDLIFPQIPGTLPDRYGNTLNNRTGSNDAYITAAKIRNGRDIFDFPGLDVYLQSMEARRHRDLEDWMDQRGLDLVVWPSAGDVGPEDVETNSTAAELAWRNGVARSNGNAAIRQLGIPTVSVMMGAMNDTHMPVDLTFAAKGYEDNALLSMAMPLRRPITNVLLLHELRNWRQTLYNQKAQKELLVACMRLGCTLRPGGLLTRLLLSQVAFRMVRTLRLKSSLTD